MTISDSLQNDLSNRIANVKREMLQQGFEACLYSTSVNMIYLCGRVINGYLYIHADEEDSMLFVKKPNSLAGQHVHYIRKPEQIIEILNETGKPLPENIMMEVGELSYSEIVRLQKAFNISTIGDATQLSRKVRSVKTPYELEQLRISAKKHAEVYEKIPSLYKPGMTDVELSIEVEREARLAGSLGIFRAFGSGMDIFMGSVLAGDNAAAPSPFDFALGGEGIDPSIPIGGNRTKLQDGMTVMIDIGGMYTAYITDMTRTYGIGKIPETAYKAHQVSIEIHEAIRQSAKPGVVCENMYNLGMEIATKNNLSEYFMGISQQAKFIGHGIGLEINELPVIAPRFKTPLQENMVFALEPKFVLPGVGAVGIENSYVVTKCGLETLTEFEENIISI